MPHAPAHIPEDGREQALPRAWRGPLGGAPTTPGPPEPGSRAGWPVWPRSRANALTASRGCAGWPAPSPAPLSSGSPPRPSGTSRVRARRWSIPPATSSMWGTRPPCPSGPGRRDLGRADGGDHGGAVLRAPFRCRPSRCRKLHTLAGRVPVFDEAQMPRFRTEASARLRPRSAAAPSGLGAISPESRPLSPPGLSLFPFPVPAGLCYAKVDLFPHGFGKEAAL